MADNAETLEEVDFLQLHPTNQPIQATQIPCQPVIETGVECKRDEQDLLGDTPQANYQQMMAICRPLLLYEIAEILKLDCEVHIIDHHIVGHLQDCRSKIHDPGYSRFH